MSPKSLSVIVAARMPPETLGQTLASLAGQRRAAEIELILADGTLDGALAGVAERSFADARYVAVPGGNLPALKGAAIRVATAELVAILDPSEAAESDWAEQIWTAFDEPDIVAVGGVVLLAGAERPGNVAAYLFEYGAFNPPVTPGDTAGDLPGNNVVYRRRALVDTCADILATEGFNKPFFHERLRRTGGRLVIRETLRVRHLTNYRFWSFGVRRFHYGRCFGAVRARRASVERKLLYRVCAPLLPPLLMSRHLLRASRHPNNRRLLPRAALALCGVCAFWGAGEWLGYWLGAGCSCQELY